MSEPETEEYKLPTVAERARAFQFYAALHVPVPRYVRVYDSGETDIDRYTVVFTGRYCHKTGGAYWYIGLTKDGALFQSGEADHPIDRPRGSHLGRRVKDFMKLPKPVRHAIMQKYAYLHDLLENDECGCCGGAHLIGADGIDCRNDDYRFVPE